MSREKLYGIRNGHQHFEEMDQEDIITAIDNFEKMGYDTSGFEDCIDWACELEDAGLEPVFLYNKAQHCVYVTSRENINCKLH